MARVTAYQSTDSKLFTDRKEYIQHQTNLNAIQEVEVLVTEAGVSAEFSAFIVANLAALREILGRRFNPNEKDASAPADVSDI